MRAGRVFSLPCESLHRTLFGCCLADLEISGVDLEVASFAAVGDPGIALRSVFEPVHALAQGSENSNRQLIDMQFRHGKPPSQMSIARNTLNPVRRRWGEPIYPGSTHIADTRWQTYTPGLPRSWPQGFGEAAFSDGLNARPLD